MTTTADGQAVVDQEKINRQLKQVVKALGSGDMRQQEDIWTKLFRDYQTEKQKRI